MPLMGTCPGILTSEPEEMGDGDGPRIPRGCSLLTLPFTGQEGDWLALLLPPNLPSDPRIRKAHLLGACETVRGSLT